MALPVTIPGGYFNVMRGIPGNGGAITYSFICGITTSGLVRSAAVAEIVVPDCDDPSVLPTTRRVTSGLDSNITGSGLYTPQNILLMEASLGKSLPYRFQAAMPPEMVAAGYSASYWSGNFICTAFTVGGTRTTGTLGTLDGAAWAADGPVLFTAGSVPA